ncbi:MAG: glucose-6-phosphate isomerase family protein [Armatimonadota bacterium]|nr:glucose-6-phosphate isomerase family protein [Armatimonadota bacterium]
MIDLSDLAGYPLKFDADTCGVSFGPDMRMPQYSTRELDALRPVLMDPDAEGPEVIYWMYRHCGQPADAALYEAHSLRYDISAFRAVTLGPEFMKTSGHYHPNIPGESVAFPEVYEVLHGEALYVMQTVDDYGASPEEVVVEDVIMCRVEAGQKIIMPPGYGHVTVNTLDEPLLMSNWVSSRFSSFYGSVQDARGFSWYVVSDGGSPSYLENKSYAQGVPAVRWAEVQEVPELGLTWGTPMYQACAEAPEKFEFLNDPGPHREQIWANLTLA